MDVDAAIVAELSAIIAAIEFAIEPVIVAALEFLAAVIAANAVYYSQ